MDVFSVPFSGYFIFRAWLDGQVPTARINKNLFLLCSGLTSVHFIGQGMQGGSNTTDTWINRSSVLPVYPREKRSIIFQGQREEERPSRTLILKQ